VDATGGFSVADVIAVTYLEGAAPAGIFGIKFFYIALGAPIVWFVRKRLAKRG
jgi:hypothetical protein|tara:strand:- start:88 stop:246 length:159 start_codon:yes stop_codon:yes gene_type:complete